MRRIASLLISCALWAGLIAARPGLPSPLPQDPPEPPFGSSQQAKPTLQSSCQITGVEPTRISPLTGGSLSVYGTGFIQGTAVRLV